MIYWCKKCKTPIFDKGLHNCSCDGKIIKISESSICNPVFKQEKKLTNCYGTSYQIHCLMTKRNIRFTTY